MTSLKNGFVTPTTGGQRRSTTSDESTRSKRLFLCVQDECFIHGLAEMVMMMIPKHCQNNKSHDKHQGRVRVAAGMATPSKYKAGNYGKQISLLKDIASGEAKE